MQKEISSEQVARLNEALLGFVSEVECLMRTPAKKKCRAMRDFCDFRGAAANATAYPTRSIPFLCDTKENRWVSFLISALRSHTRDVMERYATEPEAKTLLAHVCGELDRVAKHPVFATRVAAPSPILVSEFSEPYRKLYHAYVIAKYALSELESEAELGLSQVNWEERDVLVGSFGSEAQFHHNLAKKYYYAPERHFDPTCFPIRYVALYQSAHFKESGVCYYGEVKAIRRVKRKKIRFGVHRQNGEEDYYLFRVKEWKRLANPIQIQDEGVFAPKFTNMFLLMRCRKTYELFHLRSALEYRCYHQILRRIAYAAHHLEWKEYYPLEGGKSIWVHNGLFDIRDERERLMCSIPVLDFSQRPTRYLEEIFACIKRPLPPSELPLWVLRENEEYEKKYGVPYREDE